MCIPTHLKFFVMVVLLKTKKGREHQRYLTSEDDVSAILSAFKILLMRDKTCNTNSLN